MTWANGMWGMGWMWFFPVIFLAVIGIFIAVFMRGMGGFSCGNSRAPRQEETPKETLDRRYAKGEITREQYLEMRKDLD